ncbi:hypothetical protein KSS87_008204 [Heliosperma pusillum]|nr:hypothetical protein KSS87_008204 [Heliosperma pusillum]
MDFQKPHAICIPTPGQGHIIPMLKLAKILHSKGFHITFVHTEYNRNRFLRSNGPNALDGLPSFRFEAIPDGLPLTEENTTQDIPSLADSIERHSLGPFKELVTRLNKDPSVPRVSCIVSDVVMYFTLDVAEELGIPDVIFWTASACALLGYAQFDKLVEKNIVPFKDENFPTNGELDQVLDWIPSMENIRLRDIPTLIRTTNPDDFLLNYIRRVMHHTKRASAIVFNSYDALEHGALDALSADFPPLYTLGPLDFILEPIEANNNETKSLTSSLWKEDSHCLEWLDSHDLNSVIYVNFGNQQTNCWHCCTKWGIGMEIDSNVNRGAVEKQVRELMTGEKGKEMKRKVMELKILAQEACASPYGSSYANIDNVIKLLQSSK